VTDLTYDLQGWCVAAGGNLDWRVDETCPTAAGALYSPLPAAPYCRLCCPLPAAAAAAAPAESHTLEPTKGD